MRTLTTIRIGNDIDVVWKVYSRNGMRFILDDKTLRLWLVSGPLKKEIEEFEIIDRNGVSFHIDSEDIYRYGVYKMVLSIMDPDADEEDATIDITEVFQVVSKVYVDTNNPVLDGDVLITPASVLNNIVSDVTPGTSVAPDEEDITIDDDLLRFKNREAGNGRGYIILRRGTPLSTQMTETDTSYEIRYDFSLNSGTLTVPSGCTLDFKGGSITNGTVKGSNTEIVNGNFSGVTFSGSFKNMEFHTDWFNMTNSSSDLTANNAAISSLITLAGLANDGRSLIVDHDIAISTPIELKRKFSLVCNGQINFYSLDQGAVAITIDDQKGAPATRRLTHHIISCRYCSLPSISSGFTLEEFIALNITGVEIIQAEPINVTFTIKKISDFTIGLSLAPKYQAYESEGQTRIGGPSVAAVFEDVNIYNSYIGIKFNKKCGYTNFATFKSGTINSDFSNCIARGENIAIAIYKTSAPPASLPGEYDSYSGYDNLPYGSVNFYNFQIDFAKVGIYTQYGLRSWMFYNLRCEQIPTLISETSDFTDNDNKSVIVVDSSTRLHGTSGSFVYHNDRYYKTFVVKDKQDNMNECHEINVRSIARIVASASYVSCNLPLLPIRDEIGTDLTPVYKKNATGGWSISSSNLIRFTNIFPCVILDSSKIKDIYFRIVVKLQGNDDSASDVRAYVCAADTNFLKIDFPSYDYTNTTVDNAQNVPTGARRIYGSVVNGYSYLDFCVMGLGDAAKYLIIGFNETPETIWLMPQRDKQDIVLNRNRHQLEAISLPGASINGGYYENIFRTDLAKPIWYTGSGWVDAAGNAITE